MFKLKGRHFRINCTLPHSENSSNRISPETWRVIVFPDPVFNSTSQFLESDDSRILVTIPIFHFCLGSLSSLINAKSFSFIAVVVFVSHSSRGIRLIRYLFINTFPNCRKILVIFLSCEFTVFL
jgi:hypothetical protein